MHTLVRVVPLLISNAWGANAAYHCLMYKAGATVTKGIVAVLKAM